MQSLNILHFFPKTEIETSTTGRTSVSLDPKPLPIRTGGTPVLLDLWLKK